MSPGFPHQSPSQLRPSPPNKPSLLPACCGSRDNNAGKGLVYRPLAPHCFLACECFPALDMIPPSPLIPCTGCLTFLPSTTSHSFPPLRPSCPFLRISFYRRHGYPTATHTPARLLLKHTDRFHPSRNTAFGVAGKGLVLRVSYEEWNVGVSDDMSCIDFLLRNG